ncbi:MAG: hypothetical protein AAGD38_12430 [Acidobacteriota bacterium]
MTRSILTVALSLIVACVAFAQTPTTLNYQGRLLQNTSDQDAATGTVDIRFSIWTGPSTEGTATELWNETWTGVTLSNGIFSVLLGSNGTPLDPADFQGDDSLYLELEVDGETLSPRQQLGSAPFAFVDEPENELQTLSLTDDQLSLSGSDDVVDLSSAAVITDLLAEIDALYARLPRLVFASSVSTTGDLGGLDGGDAFCQGLADAAGLGGTYKAWLSDPNGSPSTRFTQDDRAFELVDGTQIAADWDDLIDGTLDAAISLDENGDAASSNNGRVWTGTTFAGERVGNSCAEWSTDTGVSAGVGEYSETDNAWTYDGLGLTCNESYLIYCFQQ